MYTNIEVISESHGSPTGKKGALWDVVILAEGKSKNGYVYPPKLLASSADAFEGVGVYAHGYGDEYNHRPNSFSKANIFSRNLVGKLGDVRYQSGVGLVGTLHLYDDTLRARIKNAWEAGDKNFLGLSIDAEASVATEGGEKVVTAFSGKAHSVDFVSFPSAGGKLQRLVASEKKINNNSEFCVMEKILNALLGKVKEGKIVLDAEKGKERDVLEAYVKEAVEGTEQEAAVSSDLDDETLAKIVDLVIKKIGQMQEMAKEKKEEDDYAKEKAAKEEAAKEAAISEAKEKAEGLKESLQAELDKVKVFNSERLLESLLDGSDLPDSGKEYVRSLFKGQVAEEGVIKEAIQSQKKVISEMVKESADVISIGDHKFAKVSVGVTGKEKKKAALLEMIAPDIFHNLQESDAKRFGIGDDYKAVKELAEGEHLYSLKEATHAYVDAHYGMTEREILKEATSGDFTSTFEDVMNKSIRAYSGIYDASNEMNKLVKKTFSPTLYDRKTVVVGGFDSYAEVSEGGTYGEPSAPSEYTVDMPFTKYGQVFKVTWEMMNGYQPDGLERVRLFPKQMAQKGIEKKNLAIGKIISGCDGSTGINSATIYDGDVLYKTGVNKTSSALDYDAFDTAWVTMREQDLLGTESQDSIVPKYLVVPYTLKGTADQILKIGQRAVADGASTGAAAIENIYKSWGVEPIAVSKRYLCQSETFWSLIGFDNGFVAPIELSFLRGESEVPMAFVQDSRTSDVGFYQDSIAFKSYYRFAVAATKRGGFYGGSLS